MLNDELMLVREFEARASDAIDCLLERIMTGENPDEAKELLRRLAEQFPADSTHALNAMTYYRGMRAALSEDDFRWLGFQDQAAFKALRRERLLQYRRWRELFEIEIESTKRQKWEGLALRNDWSQLSQYVPGGLKTAKAKAMLRLAAVMYRANVPGALDVCDAAAFALFRAAYLQA